MPRITIPCPDQHQTHPAALLSADSFPRLLGPLLAASESPLAAGGPARHTETKMQRQHAIEIQTNTPQHEPTAQAYCIAGRNAFQLRSITSAVCYIDLNLPRASRGNSWREPHILCSSCHGRVKTLDGDRPSEMVDDRARPSFGASWPIAPLDM